jgi:hypothetical protein
VTQTLKEIVGTAGIPDIMELNQVPFGNNFYTTTECGGAPYDPSKRHCWSGKCIGTTTPAADCFTGAIVAQHGDDERNMNRMQACGKWQNTTWQDYWPFLYCMESAYDVTKAQECAKGTKIDGDAVEACYKGSDGDLAQLREAKQTVDHPGTPDVAVAGKSVSFPVTASSIIKAVCDAYGGTKPAACSGAQNPTIV